MNSVELYSFKNYFRVIAISQPKKSTPTKNATESLNAKGDVKSSDQYEMSQSDKDILGYVSNFETC